MGYAQIVYPNPNPYTILSLSLSQPLLYYTHEPDPNPNPYAGFRLTCRSPLCRVIIACCFRVAALSGNAALALSPSGIAPKLNRIQLSAICRGGQSGKVID